MSGLGGLGGLGDIYKSGVYQKYLHFVKEQGFEPSYVFLISDFLHPQYQHLAACHQTIFAAIMKMNVMSVT